MWAIGCVLYEILHLATESHDLSKNDIFKPIVLFKGDSSYPLSPKANESQEEVLGIADQLYITVQQLGVITDHDLSGIFDENARTYVKQLQL